MIAMVLNTSKVDCFVGGYLLMGIRIIILCFLVDAQSTKCGNFVVEDDEECDAGHGRDDPCCDDNCKLRPEANCRWVVCVYVGACTCALACVCICVSVCACVCVCISVCVYKCVCVCVYKCVCV